MNDLINLLIMSKEETYEYCLPKYKALKENGHYQEVLISEKKRITELKKSYSNNMDFYKAVALEFTNRYIDILINEYKDKISEDQIKKLNKLKTEEGVKILKPGEAVEIGLLEKNKDGSPMGSEGAFAKSDLGIICFTPEFVDYKIDVNSLTFEQKEELAIKNVLRMMGPMIHETFHLLINVRDRYEKFTWNINGKEESITGPAGHIMNEAIVEKYAIDFAAKYRLPQNPALYYLHYVELYNEISNKSSNNSYNVFTDNYKKILSSVLSEDELNLYRYNERIKYFETFHNLSDIKISMDNITDNNFIK